MHEYVTILNVVYPNGTYFEKGKTKCSLNQLPRGGEIDNSHGKRLLLRTITTIKVTLDTILENPEYAVDILKNPSSIDHLLKN